MSYQTQPVRLIGGRLCLDFLNTADWSADGNVVDEKLATKSDLGIWCRHVGIPKKASQLSSDSMENIREFRAQLRRIFLAAAQDSEPMSTDLAALNEVLHRQNPPNSLVVSQRILTFSDAMSLEQILSQSAVSILSARHEIGRVKLCPSDDCGWLFLDESRNKRRLWCSMETCGNRAKARRYYKRNSETEL